MRKPNRKMIKSSLVTNLTLEAFNPSLSMPNSSSSLSDCKSPPSLKLRVSNYQAKHRNGQIKLVNNQSKLRCPKWNGKIKPINN